MSTSQDSGPRWELELAVQAGEFSLSLSLDCRARVLALYGPSGAGKSTVVECLAGVREFQGKAVLGGRPQGSWRVGWVPQEGALFPHLSVARNIDFAGCQGARRDRAIEVLGLGDLLERMPSSLSGGEAQRVALARAIASEPDLLLLDEPLSGVDLPRRARIFRLLQQIRDTFELPMLYVSHDPAEVLAIAEHACLLEDGLLVASGTPESLLGDASALRFIDHLGFDNVLRVQRVEGRARTPGGRLLHAPPAPGSGEAGWLAVRSQDVMLATEEPRGLSARNCFPAEILSMDTQDGGVQVTLQAEDLWRARLTEAAVTELGLEVGLSAWLVVKTHSLHWLAD